MSDNNDSRSGGIGFGGLLGIVFIILKLTGTVDWKWIWVLSPLWGGFAIVIIILIVVAIVAAVLDVPRKRW